MYSYILIQKPSAEEESAEAVHVQRNIAYESGRELHVSEMTIEEDKISEKIYVAKPEEKQAFLPTVTITPPLLENSDSLDQINSSDGEAIFNTFVAIELVVFLLRSIDLAQLYYQVLCAS